jgi:hypothetical protein
MSGQCRFSANSLLRTAKEALDRPCRCEEAGATPERALPRSGTFSRCSTRFPGKSARGFHVGFGAWTASAEHVLRLLRRYGEIAICTAGVLNSPRALTASPTGELTRNERAERHGGTYTETRWCIQRYHQRVVASDCSRREAQRWSEFVEGRSLHAFAVGGDGSHRAELRGLTSTGIAALP